METQYKPGILFRFRRPSDTPKQHPSKAMTEALRHLAESDEMRPFVAEAHAQRRNVVVEVFHSRGRRIHCLSCMRPTNPRNISVTASYPWPVLAT